MHLERQSRRAVLAAGVAGVAAGVCGGRAFAQAGSQAEATAGSGSEAVSGRSGEPLPAVLKVSIAGYTFRDDLDKPGKPGKMSLFDLADMAARWGIDAIEPTSYYFLRDDDEYVHALKRRVFLNGLEISGTPVGNNFCLPPGPELRKEIDAVKKWVDICVKLGSPAIRVFAGREDKGRSRDEVFRVLVEAMREAAEYAGSRGIFLGLENHGYMTETADDVLRIVDAVGHDWLGVNLDTGNFKSHAYAQIAKLAPRSVICQVKAQVATEDGRKEPVDMERVVRILREARYRGYVALEYEGKNPHEEAPRMLRRLQAVIQA